MWFDTFLKEENENPEQMVRIINERNFDRLDGLLRKTEGRIVYGGNKNREDKYIQPTVVTDVSMSGIPLIFVLTQIHY
jgi:aldehyde dehydrogenase (NAD+)